MPLPIIPLDYVAEVLNESGKRFYISEYIWSKHGGNCKYRKGEETYEEDANKFVHEKFSKYNWWHNKHSNFWQINHLYFKQSSKQGRCRKH